MRDKLRMKFSHIDKSAQTIRRRLHESSLRGWNIDAQSSSLPGITAERYVEEILRLHIIPMRHQTGCNFILMHDNVRPHTTRIALNFFEKNNIEVLLHPAMKPRFKFHQTCIEYDEKKTMRFGETANLQQLKAVLQQIWHKVLQTTIKSCINMQASARNHAKAERICVFKYAHFFTSKHTHKCSRENLNLINIVGMMNHKVLISVVTHTHNK